MIAKDGKRVREAWFKRKVRRAEVGEDGWVGRWMRKMARGQDVAWRAGK